MTESAINTSPALAVDQSDTTDRPDSERATSSERGPGSGLLNTTELTRAFTSILYESGSRKASRETPAHFRDLNLDQVVAAMLAGREEYDLAPFFHDPLRTGAEVCYRHDVMRDLEDGQVLSCIEAFAAAMRSMRQTVARAAKLHYRLQKERWFLHAAEAYCAAIRDLSEGLARVRLGSRGLAAFRDYLGTYIASGHFCALAAEARKTAEDLAAVRYTILITGGGLKVRRYDAERDYGTEIKEAFDKFQQDAARSYLVQFTEHADMNHIEARVLDFVALLHPEAFAALGSFVTRHHAYAEPVITAFDREIQFYVAYLSYIGVIKQAGLSFCYPAVSATDKDVSAEDSFDLALAAKLLSGGGRVVCNDFALRGQERILVVSGPNQGGKTTFARTFGQMHYLAALGCPVPGRTAQLLLFDHMFTHFERMESIETLRGKLQDDLVRIHAILEQATPRSIVIMNEIFASTTLADAVFLARKVMDRLVSLGALGVCVTFLDELASLGEQTVSMVSTIVPGDPAARTFKVVRQPADGRSYAVSLAEKHGLTYERLAARLRRGAA